MHERRQDQQAQRTEDLAPHGSSAGEYSPYDPAVLCGWHQGEVNMRLQRTAVPNTVHISRD